MSVRIGHASISENGTAQGTKGDQTGKEVCIRDWYNYSGGWDFIAIHPDANVREKHASTVEAACANDNVGYGQDDRNTLHTQAVKVDYDLSKITTTCNCDCSSLQHVAAIASGAMPESSYGSNAMVTSTMKSVLSSYGYSIITSSTYAQNSSYCVRGAIYVKSGHHTVTGLDNGSNYQSTLSKAGASSSSSGSTVTIEDAASKDESLAGTYVVTGAGSLNVRSGAGTTKTVIVTIPDGTSVQNYGYYTTVSGTKWLYIAFTYNGTSYKGFASSQYLVKSGSSSSSSDGSMTATADPKTIWDYLYSKIGNAYGVAGVMGNMYAESALIPINLQDSYEKKLGYTDESYTKAVDNGTYTNFVKDSAGYGLVQWTYYSLKQDLIDYCKSKSASIGNLDAQLGCLMQEFEGEFSSLLKTLKNATSVKEASDAMLTKFERPSDQSDSVKSKRASYGQTYYDKYASGSSSSGTTSSTGSSGGTTSTTSSSGSLTVDGQIGKKTVKKWQQVMGSTADGYIDGQQSASKKYWTSIISEACGWSGGSSAVVKKWQQYLKNKGYSVGVAGTDGKLGKNTAKASQQFLNAMGYSCGSVDGIFGTNSAKALQKWLNAQ